MSDEKPFVITISRQLGSGGSYLGQRIAARLGIHYADREIVRKAAIMLQVEEDVVEPMDEKVTPSWQSLLRVFDNGMPEFGYLSPNNLPPLDNEFHLAECSVISEIAENDSSVILGRGGCQLLKDNPRHLAVFLFADTSFRNKRIQKLHNVSEKDADNLIEMSDHDRKRYFHNVVKADWQDARQYHLSIDTSALGFVLAENIIIDSLRARLERISE